MNESVKFMEKVSNGEEKLGYLGSHRVCLLPFGFDTPLKVYIVTRLS